MQKRFSATHSIEDVLFIIDSMETMLDSYLKVRENMNDELWDTLNENSDLEDLFNCLEDLDFQLFELNHDHLDQKAQYA